MAEYQDSSPSNGLQDDMPYKIRRSRVRYCYSQVCLVASFTKEVNPRIAKLKTNGRLANRRLTSLVKEVTVAVLQPHRIVEMQTQFIMKYGHGSVVLCFVFVYYSTSSSDLLANILLSRFTGTNVFCMNDTGIVHNVLWRTYWLWLPVSTIFYLFIYLSIYLVS